MSGGWLDVQGPQGSRREALREGLTTLGGSRAHVPLEGVGSDQLQVWNRPPRALFLGSGPRPTCNGLPLEEVALRPGDRIEWGAHTLLYGGEPASGDQASLVELALPPAAAPEPAAAPVEGEPRRRLHARVLAGLACDLGMADPAAVKRWQKAVLEQRFEADLAASEVFPGEPGAEAQQRLLDRAGTLLRDFLMAGYLKGARGAGRRARESSRNLVAFLLAQGLALIVFAAIVVAIMVVLHVQGVSFDALLERVVPS